MATTELQQRQQNMTYRQTNTAITIERCFILMVNNNNQIK